MMAMETWNIERELKGLEKDRELSEKALESHKERYAQMMREGIGEDIDAVLSGKRTVKLSFKERVKYRTRRIMDLIFDMF